MIPVSCLLEVVFDNVRYSRDVKLSILVVLTGVGITTISDVSVNFKGFVAAAIAVWSTALQQYVSFTTAVRLCGCLFLKHGMHFQAWLPFNRASILAIEYA
jgi:hypothetical protein